MKLSMLPMYCNCCGDRMPCARRDGDEHFAICEACGFSAVELFNRAFDDNPLWDVEMMRGFGLAYAPPIFTERADGSFTLMNRRFAA